MKYSYFADFLLNKDEWCEKLNSFAVSNHVIITASLSMQSSVLMQLTSSKFGDLANNTTEYRVLVDKTIILRQTGRQFSPVSFCILQWQPC